jgi:hypothetical protein
MTRLAWILIVIITIAWSGFLSAAEGVPAGFQNLLNGRNLAGWKIQSGQIGSWSLSGGKLVASGSPPGWLFTEKEYSDIELQSFANQVEFRNIAIKSLSPANPAVPATPPRVDRIETFEKGIYQVPIDKEVADPNAASGKRFIENKTVTCTQVTATIPAQKGVNFGFRYRIVGEPKGSPITLKRVFVFPPGGITNPKTGKTTFQESVELSRKIGEVSHTSYRLGDWGRVPGTWTFQIWCQDRKLAEESFTVVNP